MASETNCEVKTRKPNSASFYQQKLVGWQPVINTRTVLPLFIFTAVGFTLGGIVLLVASSKLDELEIPYHDCRVAQPPTSNSQANPGGGGGATCAEQLELAAQNFSANPHPRCVCAPIQFRVERRVRGPIFVYYTLSRFYQNHRQYLRSRDAFQLLGRLPDELNSYCEPFRELAGQKISPCGVIANSLFNDSFTISRANSSAPLNWTDSGVAWSSDQRFLFGKPPPDSWLAHNLTAPPAWPRNEWVDEQPRLFNAWPRLLVWMRPAALPTFRKLYRRIDADLQPGDYLLRVSYAFPTHSFSGAKSVVLSNTNSLGSRSYVIGALYLTLGIVHIFLCAAFLLVNKVVLPRQASTQQQQESPSSNTQVE